jgi:hypothetical protein
MSTTMRRPEPRPRRHGVRLEPSERRELERAGWRTTLDYRENHVRGRDGRLVAVEPCWTAEAERFDRDVMVATACAATPEEAWCRLLDEVRAGRAAMAFRRLRLLAR